MTKKIVISEKDNIAAVLENGKVSEFFVHKGDVLLGDVYLSQVDNILPSIDAAFVDVGLDKMGFIHNSDIMGKGNLKEKVKPKQKLIVQVVKEPTGHKGPRVTTALSLPGRFLVLLPDEKGVNVSKKIISQKERARLKSLVSLLKPVGVGVIVRTEAEGQSESEIQEDIEILLEKWNSIVNAADNAQPPCLLYRDQDLLYRVIREACTDDVDEILVDTAFSMHRATQLLQHWNVLNKIKVTLHKGNDPLLVSTGIHKEISNALNTKVNLPLGGYLYIQQTEALTVVDVNSGKFTSSGSQAETILKTNLQAAEEIARQLKLRNIGGMIIVDFIDMNNRMDKLAVLEHFELALDQDKAKPQIGQLSDLGLVELTRHRQGQSLAEIFTKKCDKCLGQGFLIEDFKLAAPTSQGEMRAKMNKMKGQFGQGSIQQNQGKQQNTFQKFNKRDDKFNKHRDKKQDKDRPKEQEGANLEIIEKELAPILENQVENVAETKQTALPHEVATEVKAEIKTEIKAEQTPKETQESPRPARKPSRKAKKSMKKEGEKVTVRTPEHNPTVQEAPKAPEGTEKEGALKSEKAPKKTSRRAPEKNDEAGRKVVKDEEAV